jgi:Ca2+/Na+ antiporter
MKLDTSYLLYEFYHVCVLVFLILTFIICASDLMCSPAGHVSHQHSTKPLTSELKSG